MSTVLDCKKSFQWMQSKRGEQGFTLVELMVSVVVGLLLMAGILQLYVNISRTNTDMTKTNGQIENGRFVIQLLQDDLSMAGFWNGFLPTFDDRTFSTAPTTAVGAPVGDLPTAVPDPCAAFVGGYQTEYLNGLLGMAVQTYDDLTLPASCTGAGTIANIQPNTDVLVVRHLENCVPGVAPCAAAAAGDVFFQASFCPADLVAPFTAHNSYVFGTAGFTGFKRDCAALADKRRYVSDIYYVRNFSVTAGDGIPTLMRSSFSGGVQTAAVPMIDGIEGFRVELGFDTVSSTGVDIVAGVPAPYTQAIAWVDEDGNAATTEKIHATNRGDGVPDGAFVRCVPCTVDQLVNVVAVKLYVLVRNREATPGYTDSKSYNTGTTNYPVFNDSYKRHLYTTTVRLNNISGRREAPP